MGLVTPLLVALALPAATGLNGPPATLTQKEAVAAARSTVADDSLVVEGTDRIACRRVSRLRFTCTRTWRELLDTDERRRTGAVWRTGTRGSPTTFVRVRGQRTIRLLTDTRRAPVGASITIHSDKDATARLALRWDRDPAPPTEFEPPASGARYVTALLAITNTGPGRLRLPAYTEDVRAILDDGQATGLAVDGVAGCSHRVDVPVGEARVACLTFEVPVGRRVTAVEASPEGTWERAQWVAD